MATQISGLSYGRSLAHKYGTFMSEPQRSFRGERRVLEAIVKYIGKQVFDRFNLINGEVYLYISDSSKLDTDLQENETEVDFSMLTTQEEIDIFLDDIILSYCC